MKGRSLFAVIMLAVLSARSQEKSIDSTYIAVSKTAFELSKNSKQANLPGNARKQYLDSAVDSYLQLDAHYWMPCQDAMQFLQASYLTGNTQALQRSFLRLIRLTGESVQVLEKRNLSGKTPLANEAEVKATMAALHQNSDSLQVIGRGAIDWPAVLVIWSSFISEQEYRALPQYIFRDSTQLPADNNYPYENKFPLGWKIGCEILDSTHLYTLYNHIKSNGFPSERTCGCYSATMWLIMRHSLDRLMLRQQKELDIYKYLWPLFYEHTKRGEFPANWYDYVYKDLIKTIREYWDDDAVAFFNRFELTGVYRDLIR